MNRASYIDVPGFGERLIRLLYPEKCVFCGELLPEAAPLSVCESCYSNLPRCRMDFAGARQIPQLDGLFAAFLYEETIKRAIHDMKFHSRPRTARTLACLIWEEMSKHTVIPDVDLIVPVPMHWRRRISRGYNQSAEIGKTLGRIMKIPVKNALAKIRHTKPQSLSTREERLKNLENSIIVRYPTAVRGLSVLLADDVVTTGATLSTCAGALKEAGAEWVFAVVIATA